MITSKETPIFIQNGSYNLFGILHEPAIPDPKNGFVFCHPFAEEKLWTHRVYVSFARELIKRGYAVLRFDHYGHGDSEGSFDQATIDHYKSDINTAIEYIKNNLPSLEKISLMGQRFGATLASHVVDSRNDISKLILWDPVLDGERYMQEILRINLTTQMAVYGEVSTNRDQLVEMMKRGESVNIDGYEMTWPMYEQACEINLNGKKSFVGDCLIMQMSKKEQSFKKELNLLKDSYVNGVLRIAIEMPFWREIKESYFRAPSLFKETLAWLEENNV